MTQTQETKIEIARRLAEAAKTFRRDYRAYREAKHKASREELNQKLGYAFVAAQGVLCFIRSMGEASGLYRSSREADGRPDVDAPAALEECVRVVAWAAKNAGGEPVPDLREVAATASRLNRLALAYYAERRQGHGAMIPDAERRETA